MTALIPRRFLLTELADQQLPRYLVLGQSVTDAEPAKDAPHFVLEESDREAHLYVCGVTGFGKSRFLEYLITQDMAVGNPLCLIDPTGLLYSKCLNFLAHCVEKVRYDATNPHGLHREEVNALLDRYLFLQLDDPDNPLRMNPLEPQDDESTEEQVDDLLKVAERLFGSIDEMRRLRQVLRNTFWVIAELNTLPVSERPPALQDHTFPLNLSFSSEFLCLKPKERNALVRSIPDTKQNHYVKEYWLRFFSRFEPSQAQERLESSWNILQYFLGDSMVRSFFDVHQSTLRIPELMRQKKSLFCYLPLGKNLKGSQLIGTFLATKFQHSAYRRSLEERQQSYYLYVDEFQEFADEQYAKATVTLRQYGLRLINAHQSQDQPPFHTPEGRSILKTIKDNSHNKVIFRVSREDAEALAPELFELSQKKFNFRYSERSVSSGESRGMTKTVSFQQSESRSLSWQRSETLSLAKTESWAIQHSRGTNIGQTLSEGIGSTVAEGMSAAITETESEGITEVWSKRDGMSVALGSGWTHVVDHQKGTTFTITEDESLAINTSRTNTHSEGTQQGETKNEGRSFTVTDSKGNNLVHTRGKSTAYRQDRGESTTTDSMNQGNLSQTSEANAEQFSTAIQNIQTVSDAVADQRGETTTTKFGSSGSWQQKTSEKIGESGSQEHTSSEQQGYDRGRQSQTGKSLQEGSSQTLTSKQEQTLSEAFAILKQVSESYTEALQKSVAQALSQGTSSQFGTTEGESFAETQSLQESETEQGRMVFYTLEGERELDTNALQKLPRRHCIVSKTALSSQEIRTGHVPDAYYFSWDEDLTTEIIERQYTKWTTEDEAKGTTPKAQQELPFPMATKPDMGDPFGF